MLKKYMIRSDLEGVTGVTSYDEVIPERRDYAYGREMFMSDLLACIEGLNAGGADEIVIYDEHYTGRNIHLGMLPDNVSVICGKPPYLKNWAGGLDESFTGLILLGLHSKFGTPNGLLAHSYESDIKNMILNGVSIGEIGLETAIAGDYHVPLLMITGDSAGVNEAKELIPGVAGVPVKKSICEWGAECLPPSLTSLMIRVCSEGIVKQQPDVLPYHVGSVTLTIEFNEGPFVKMFRTLYGIEMKHESAIEIKAATATEAWSIYWQMKLTTKERMKQG